MSWQKGVNWRRFCGEYMVGRVADIVSGTGSMIAFGVYSAQDMLSFMIPIKTDKSRLPEEGEDLLKP